MTTNKPTEQEARETVCANCDVKLYQTADPNNIHWYHEGTGDVRCPTRFAEPRRVDPPAAPTGNYRLDIDHQIYEEDLPAGITKALYDQWFAKSRIVDGVRMGPAVAAITATLNSNVIGDLLSLLSKDAQGRWCFNSLSRDADKFHAIVERLTLATCGAACTREEYEQHRALGHDAAIGVGTVNHKEQS